MADKNQQPLSTTPQHPPEVEQVQRVLAFLKEYGQSIVIGVGLAIAVGLGIVAYRNYRETSALRASQLLLNARSLEEVQQVVRQYSGLPVTPLALLALAARYYDEGQYELARNTFRQVKEKYPKHSLVAMADLGRAQCLEAEGQLEAALQAFSAFISDYPKHFLTPLARIGKARCLHQLGRYAEARAEYEEIMAQYADSDWATVAESGVLFVGKDERLASRGIAEEPITTLPEETATDLSPVEPPPSDTEPAKFPPEQAGASSPLEEATPQEVLEEPPPEETEPGH